MPITNEQKFKDAQDYITNEGQSIDNIVNAIVKKYSFELDDFVNIVRENLELVKKNVMDTYDDENLQMQMIKLPTILYFVGNGLESIGSDSEVAEYHRKQLFNEVIDSLSTEKYTIPDKKAKAEKQTEYEAMLKEIYDRAYKKLKLKIDHATKLLESMKKVADIRIAKINKGKGGDEQSYRSRRES